MSETTPNTVALIYLELFLFNVSGLALQEKTGLRLHVKIVALAWEQGLPEQKSCRQQCRERKLFGIGTQRNLILIPVLNKPVREL